MQNETLTQLYKRKSVRAFTGQDIEPDKVQAILEASMMAPTAGNQQLYTILNVTDPELCMALADACDHQSFIASGKLVLLYLADCLKWYEAFQAAGCSPRKPGPGDLLLAVDDAVIAAQNAVVAAESMGIGSCYIGDIMENCAAIQKLLHLPRYVFPAVLLVFGYPTPQQLNRRKPERVDSKYIVHENTYRHMEAADLEAMLRKKCGNTSYADWMQAFCRRKYNSDFSREMSRSVTEYLEQYLGE